MSAAQPDAILELVNVTKRFGGLVAVDAVGFSVPRGQALGIMGPNGAGKTTLFNLVSGFETPTTGHVAFRGEPITGVSPDRVARRGLVRTFQVVRPFPGLSVLENLMVGGLDDHVFDRGVELAHARERACRMAERVGLSAWLDQEAATMPYGGLKRLEVGRAMMLDPAVLLLDEPFAGLAPQETAELSQVIQGLIDGGTTLLIIEHKLGALMRLVRRVVVLHFGRLIADGTAEQVAADPAVREAYLGAKGSQRFA
jgi:branched-chain amino acid transport system ATP-binding protein